MMCRKSPARQIKSQGPLVHWSIASRWVLVIQNCSCLKNLLNSWLYHITTYSYITTYCDILL